MVTLEGSFKRQTGRKWHIMPIVDIADSEIELRRWVEIWLDVLAMEYRRFEGWVFQR